MKACLFSSEKLPETSLGREYNAQNGNDAEILTASNIIKAFNAEVRWGSRNEDGKKMDLLISYNHPWRNGDRILLVVQVKAGASYGRIKNERLLLYKSVFRKVKRESTSICLIWLDYNSGENYWAYVSPNTKVEATEFGSNHLVSPAIRYEIARYLAKKNGYNKIGAKGMKIKEDIDKSNFVKLRNNIRSTYRSYEAVNNPLLGSVEFTNLGLKHLFRVSRKKEYKLQSLVVLPYLKGILKRVPNKHWINSYNRYKRKSFDFWQYEHILRYKVVTCSASVETEKIVVIKILEEVSFPTMWKSESLLSQKVKRRVVFKSCSLKERK